MRPVRPESGSEALALTGEPKPVPEGQAADDRHDSADTPDNVSEEDLAGANFGDNKNRNTTTSKWQ